MILVTGGAGFIGSHTVRALLAAGQECVLVQRRPALPPHLADLPVQVVPADVTDLDALLAVGRRYPITGIVHLAIALPWPAGADEPVQAARRALDGFLNIVRAAEIWGVQKIVTASTIGVYGGVTATGGLTEDTPLSLQHHHVIPTFKKITELLAGHLSDVTGVHIVAARISGTWGPGGHLPDPFFAAPSLVQAAALGRAPDLSGLVAPAHREDALDLCYVKDTGRALALLQTAGTLHHGTYNVASGRATSNADVLRALADAVPGFSVALPSAGTRPMSWLDTTRLRQDTGFRPEFDTAAAVADYLAWLRAGNER